MTTQERIKAEADAKGFVVLSGAGEHAAARALARKGLVELSDRAQGGVYGGTSQNDRATTAYSLSAEWK